MDDELEKILLDIVDVSERLKKARSEMSDLDRMLTGLNARKSAIEEQKRQEKLVPTVSDHAVIRFLERKYGFDFEHIREEILTRSVKSMIEFGAESIKVDSGRFKVKDKKIVTFITNKKR